MKGKWELKNDGMFMRFKCPCGNWIEFVECDKEFLCPNCGRRWLITCDFGKEKYEVMEVGE